MTKPLVRIVDDDEELLRSTAFLIRMAGFDVLTYSSAISFLSMDDPTRPGCLLLDHRMPGMTGMELQETLVERGETIPVIFLSAHGDIPMAMQAVHRGALDFLVKPVDPEVLVEAVRKAVQKSLDEVRTAELLNKQIADRLGISLPTVKMHRGNVTKKLGVRSAVAIARALERANLLNGGEAR